MKQTTFKVKKVAGIEESLAFMRFPHQSEGDSAPFDHTLDGEAQIDNIGSDDYRLANKLSVSKGGTGHDSYLKGIQVWLEVEAPHYMWAQMQRYKWFDIVSSTSKMYTLTKKDVSGKCTKFVSKDTITLMEVLILVYNNYDEYDNEFRIGILEAECIQHMPKDRQEWFQMILDNLPMGYQLTAGVTTNYLSLKNMYRQRKNHKLAYWNEDFVEMIKSLPLSELLTK